jgi:hypothetical protein
MVLGPSFRIFLLLSLLLPVMVIAGGCMFFWSIKPVPRNGVDEVVANDPSYDRPPDAFFWRLFPVVARQDPQTGETVFEERSTKVDTALLIGDLQRHLKADPNSTATAYFSSHGMTCKPAGVDTECRYAMIAIYACLYTVNDKPQPPDYASRYPGQIGLAIKLSNNDIVKSVFPIIWQRCPRKP